MNLPDHAQLQAWLHQFGTLAVFVGTLLEGETVMLLGGAAVRNGELSGPAVVLAAALGGWLGDAMLFALGRWKGLGWLARRPRVAPALARINALIGRHGTMTVIGVRFAYGLRLVGPYVIGASGLPWLRFAAANTLGALLWALAWVGAGAVADDLVRQLTPLGGWALVPAALLLAWGLWRWWNARRSRRPS